MENMEWLEECQNIKKQFSTNDISFMIEELRVYVEQNAVLRETVSRANNTLNADIMQQNISNCFHYSITHSATN